MALAVGVVDLSDHEVQPAKARHHPVPFGDALDAEAAIDVEVGNVNSLAQHMHDVGIVPYGFGGQLAAANFHAVELVTNPEYHLGSVLSLAAGVHIEERLIEFRKMGYLAPGKLDQVIRHCLDGHYDEDVASSKRLVESRWAHRSRPQRLLEHVVRPLRGRF